MKNSKKVLVTTATSEIFIIRRKGMPQTFREFCPHCRKLTEMLDFDSAVTVFGVGARKMMRQIETGDTHSTETASGHLLVCPASLVTAIRK